MCELFPFMIFRGFSESCALSLSSVSFSSTLGEWRDLKAHNETVEPALPVGYQCMCVFHRALQYSLELKGSLLVPFALFSSLRNLRHCFNFFEEQVMFSVSFVSLTAKNVRVSLGVSVWAPFEFQRKPEDEQHNGVFLSAVISSHCVECVWS